MEENLETAGNSSNLQEKSTEKSGGNLNNSKQKPDISFKKPSFIGKARGLKKSLNVQKTASNKLSIPTEKPVDPPRLAPQKEKQTQPKKETEISEKEPLPLPYKEPIWSGLPPQGSKAYTFEVLKNGCIIETINLMEKPFWVFGRLPNCDISMQHPTISRYHAVLQYRLEGTGSEEPGFYIYDLSSTHGTFLNKNNKLKSRVYTKIHVGHMLRLGCSQRSFILTGPDQDQEAESEFTITELKQQKADRIQQAKEEFEKRKLQEERRKKKEAERGIDWGMGEDASEDEEEDEIAENPFAQTNNEELYLDDPKKALRGFFEREGLDLEYDCTEQGMGQFLCKVELPLDDDLGRPIVAEVIHKGKKKEAVIQCALEACRTLDRYGVLRQAMHESRKRKTKNWEENDYYDSDDDTFLDRTGTIEKKREKRMSAKQPQKAETYESLVEKEKTLSDSIANLEEQIKTAKDLSAKNLEQVDEDSLDSFMKNLNEPRLDKQKLSKNKLELAQLKKKHANVIRLMNIAKPANIPSLSPQITQREQLNKPKTVFPIVGKRSKIKLQLPKRPENENLATSSYAEGEDVEEEYDDETNDIEKDTNIKTKQDEKDKRICRDTNESHKKIETKVLDTNVEMEDCLDETEDENSLRDTTEMVQRDLLVKSQVITTIAANLKSSSEKIDKCQTQNSEKTEEKSTNPADSLVETLKRSSKPSNKKRKKEGDEKIKGYEGENLGEDYSMWVPPSDQSGDGKTSLNDKLGY